MRVPSHHSRTGLEFNMTPMINVVFLLIIFFLVSSHLAQQETQVELVLSDAKTGEVLKRVDLTINIKRDGVIWLGGKQVDEKELHRMLGVEIKRIGGDLDAHIRADRRVEYKYIEPILLACAKTGIWSVNFRVNPKH